MKKVSISLIGETRGGILAATAHLGVRISFIMQVPAFIQNITNCNFSIIKTQPKKLILAIRVFLKLSVDLLSQFSAPFPALSFLTHVFPSPLETLSITVSFPTTLRRGRFKKKVFAMHSFSQEILVPLSQWFAVITWRGASC